VGRRYFRHGELHLVLLALLDARPMHGYELMAELARLFGPAYRPSPGSIYPAVSALEAEGLVTSVAHADRRVHHLTDAGATALAQRLDDLAALESRTGARLRTSDAVDAALSRLSARVRAVAGRADHGQIERVLDDAADRIEALGTAPSGREQS
jgi:DNA-binding PadR family transcriptional regulator